MMLNYSAETIKKFQTKITNNYCKRFSIEKWDLLETNPFKEEMITLIYASTLSTKIGPVPTSITKWVHSAFASSYIKDFIENLLIKCLVWKTTWKQGPKVNCCSRKCVNVSMCQFLNMSYVNVLMYLCVNMTYMPYIRCQVSMCKCVNMSFWHVSVCQCVHMSRCKCVKVSSVMCHVSCVMCQGIKCYVSCVKDM